MAQWLRAQTDLVEDLSLVSTQGSSQPRDLTPSSGFHKHQHSHVYITTHRHPPSTLSKVSNKGIVSFPWRKRWLYFSQCYLRPQRLIEVSALPVGVHVGIAPAVSGHLSDAVTLWLSTKKGNSEPPGLLLGSRFCSVCHKQVWSSCVPKSRQARRR